MNGNVFFDDVRLYHVDGGSPDPSFESGSHTGWYASSGTVTIVTSPTHKGIYSALISSGTPFLHTASFRIESGYTYAANIWFWAQSGQWGKLSLWDNISSRSADHALMGNGDWQKLTAWLDCTSSAVNSAQVYLYGNTSGTSEVVYDDFEISRWIDLQFDERLTEPKRLFLIGTSDYTERVMKWPKVKQAASTDQVKSSIQSQTVTIQLANHDGLFNDFYRLNFSVQEKCSLKMGFETGSGTVESMPVWTGKMQLVRYPSEGVCEIRMRDMLYDLTQRIAGGQDSATLTYSSVNPANLAWSLCTSWGRLSSTASTSNPDIDYAKWASWQSQCSEDLLQAFAQFTGGKVIEYLQTILRITDSYVYVDEEGKVCFNRLSEISSLGVLFDRSSLKSMSPDVEALQIINEQTVNFNFSVVSDYWQGATTFVNSTSQNTYGVRSDTFETDDIWFTNSAGAINLAQRRVDRWQYPNIRFKNVGGYMGAYLKVGHTAWVVNSFYAINSESGFRIVSKEIDMQDGSTTWELDEAGTLRGFYLDITSLDGDEVLL